MHACHGGHAIVQTGWFGRVLIMDISTGCETQAEGAAVAVTDEVVLQPACPLQLASPRGIQAARDPAVFR